MEQEVQNVESVETETTENTETQTAKQNEPKTFTQEEVNEIVKSRLAKVEKKYANVDLDKYNEYLESQKTEAEKQAEVLNENTELKARISELEHTNAVANANVSPKFQKFVISEVSGMEGEFNDNLTKYLEDNKQYLNIVEEPKKPTTTGLAQSGTNKPVSENKAYLDRKYANNPYYKK